MSGTVKLYVQFLDQNKPISKYGCKNEEIYIRDFEAVQKTRSRVSSGLKTRGNLSASPRDFKPDTLHSRSFFEQYLITGLVHRLRLKQMKKAVKPVGLG